MAKPELVPPKDEPKPWTPDQPLEDEEDEKETQRKARATARLNHLTKTYETPVDDGKKKKKSSLW
jgi:hypothetical protein